MLQFRCWYCNKRYVVADGRVGERLTCTCERRLRVPKQSGGNSRHKTLVDRLVELVVYGGGGGLLGFGLALLLVSRLRIIEVGSTALFLLACTAIGFLMGGLCGEAGVNWIGRQIRSHE